MSETLIPPGPEWLMLVFGETNHFSSLRALYVIFGRYARMFGMNVTEFIPV